MFVTFEGIDGCGKTTVMAEVAKRLPGKVFCTKEPTKPIDLDFTNNTQRTLAYLLDRAMHAPLLEDAIKYNDFVLCDRYHGSTIAYQGENAFTAVWGYFPEPDLTLWLAIKTSEAKIRRRKRGEMEEPLYDLDVVQKRYREQYKSNENWRVIDAMEPFGNVVEQCVSIILERDRCLKQL